MEVPVTLLAQALREAWDKQDARGNYPECHGIVLAAQSIADVLKTINPSLDPETFLKDAGMGHWRRQS